jgi:hypothetical protein
VESKSHFKIWAVFENFLASARTFSSKTIPKILFFDIPGKAGRYFGDLNAEETNREYLNFKNRFFTDFVLIRKSQFVEI